MIKILLADDEQSSIMVLKRLINFKKYELELVGEARNGEEAMRYLEMEDPPEIVISDMRMPVMNGISLIQYIQDNYPAIKIIICSGYFDFEYTHAAIKAGVIEYLLKPVDRVKLDTAISEACEAVENDRAIAIKNSDEKINLSIDIYKEVLQCSKSLIRLIDFGNIKASEALITGLQERIDPESRSKDTGRAVFRVMMAYVQRYLVEHGMPPQVIDDAAVNELGSFSEALDYLNRNVKLAIEEKNASSDQQKNRSVEEVRRYLDDHYKERIRLEQVADKFNYNKDYLTTIFRKKYGETIGDYIIRLKIDDAKQQLKYTSKTMEEILQSLGYSDSSFFYRQFKQVTGISPGHYRRKENAFWEKGNKNTS